MKNVTIDWESLTCNSGATLVEASAEFEDHPRKRGIALTEAGSDSSMRWPAQIGRSVHRGTTGGAGGNFCLRFAPYFTSRKEGEMGRLTRIPAMGRTFAAISREDGGRDCGMGALDSMVRRDGEKWEGAEAGHSVANNTE